MKKLVNFASQLEEQALEQAERTSRLPFVYPHVALMPDAHFGMGATVGSVIPTHGAIIPAAIGVDIGCGMIAVKTDVNVDEELGEEKRKELYKQIERAIPLNAGSRNGKITKTALPLIDELEQEQRTDYEKFAKHWRHQLGSLGSGNHFIEISLDEENNVWAFLHSGSRGVGFNIANHHIRIAKDIMAKYFIDLEDDDLAYLVEGTNAFDDYIWDMQWAQKFAYYNRQEMMTRVLRQIEEVIGRKPLEIETINCHHNFTQKEHHMGKDYWITRKGAIAANEGQLGLIPGSMGDESFVVEGLGNKTSFCSAPHGAGRQLSRRKAKETQKYSELKQRMEGVIWGEDRDFLDETPKAYKPIANVMKDAESLVKPLHTLRQIINLKGK